MIWTDFFDRYHIEYVTSGPNVGKGHVAIACPFCRDDPSHHLSVAVNGEGWRCFRNRDHSGVSPVRLIETLLHCSRQEALHIAGVTQKSLSTDFLAEVTTILDDGKQEEEEKRDLLQMPDYFRAISVSSHMAKPFVRYLQHRGFGLQDIYDMTNGFNIRCCAVGRFAGRVIFPVYHGGHLMTWTGRAIRHSDARYLTLGKNEAAARITDYLLWYDKLVKSEASTICICEGPFDALKVWYLGLQYRIVSTCFFTSEPSPAQISQLYKVLPRFERKLLLLDRDMVATSMKTADRLTTLGVSIRFLPPGLKDPGDFSENEFVSTLVHKH
ncbi:MAG: hypothetical protein L0287_34975 [Anaerolineae bacterium]|nr:hypothetical protein [Anaerolineae bacterium]